MYLVYWNAANARRFISHKEDSINYYYKALESVPAGKVLIKVKLIFELACMFYLIGWRE
jgi:hypothetical protein